MPQKFSVIGKIAIAIGHVECTGDFIGELPFSLPPKSW